MDLQPYDEVSGHLDAFWVANLEQAAKLLDLNAFRNWIDQITLERRTKGKGSLEGSGDDLLGGLMPVENWKTRNAVAEIGPPRLSDDEAEIESDSSTVLPNSIEIPSGHPPWPADEMAEVESLFSMPSVDLLMPRVWFLALQCRRSDQMNKLCES
jgi:hypothetical protein